MDRSKSNSFERKKEKDFTDEAVAGTVHVNILSGRNLDEKNVYARLNPFCRVTFGDVSCRTRPAYGTTPLWDEHLSFEYDHEEIVRVEVFDSTQSDSASLIGSCQVLFTDAYLDGDHHIIDLPLTRNNGRVPAGFLKMIVFYNQHCRNITLEGPLDSSLTHETTNETLCLESTCPTRREPMSNCLVQSIPDALPPFDTDETSKTSDGLQSAVSSMTSFTFGGFESEASLSKTKPFNLQSEPSLVETLPDNVKSAASLSESPPDNVQSECPPVGLQSEAPPVDLHSEDPPVDLQSESLPDNVQSAASLAESAPDNFQSESAPDNFQSESPPVDLQSEAPPVDLQSEAAPVDLQSEAAPVDLQSEALPYDVQSESSVAESPPVDLQFKASLAESPPVDLQVKASLAESPPFFLQSAVNVGQSTGSCNSRGVTSVRDAVSQSSISVDATVQSSISFNNACSQTDFDEEDLSDDKFDILIDSKTATYLDITIPKNLQRCVDIDVSLMRNVSRWRLS